MKDDPFTDTETDAPPGWEEHACDKECQFWVYVDAFGYHYTCCEVRRPEDEPIRGPWTLGEMS